MRETDQSAIQFIMSVPRDESSSSRASDMASAQLRREKQTAEPRPDAARGEGRGQMELTIGM